MNKSLDRNGQGAYIQCRKFMIARKKLTVKEDRNGELRYPSNIGRFFIYSNRTKTVGGPYGDVYRCREVFGEDFESRHRFVGFQIDKDIDVKSLASKWDSIESKLGLKSKTRFYRTNQSNTVILEAAKFWLANSTRRGFFSLFLRAVVAYDKGEFYKTINSYRLARRITPTIKHFMAGNTNPTYRDDRYLGIVNFFSNKQRQKANLSNFLTK